MKAKGIKTTTRKTTLILSRHEENTRMNERPHKIGKSSRDVMNVKTLWFLCHTSGMILWFQRLERQFYYNESKDLTHFDKRLKKIWTIRSWCDHPQNLQRHKISVVISKSYVKKYDKVNRFPQFLLRTYTVRNFLSIFQLSVVSIDPTYQSIILSIIKFTISCHRYWT